MKMYSKIARYPVAVDCIIFGYDILEKELKLLLIKRSFEPAKGQWSLAGGFIDEDESLDEAAIRILLNLTGLKMSSWNSLIVTELLTEIPVPE